MPDYKIGDRVRYTGTAYLGMEGVIVSINDGLLLVEFDGRTVPSSTHRLNVTPVCEPLPDKELADEYRRLRAEAFEVAEELVGRGYACQAKPSGSNYWQRRAAGLGYSYRFKKTTTKTVMVPSYVNEDVVI